MIGLLGGTFDPIHFGHLRLALEVAEAIHADEVRFIPAGMPPHRQSPLADKTHRSAMVDLAIAGNPLFQLDNRECERPGPSYTIDTLKDMRREYPNLPICLFLGADAWLSFSSWRCWQDFTHLVHLVIAHRPGFTLRQSALPLAQQALFSQSLVHTPKQLHEKNAGFIYVYAITALEISASGIRGMVRRGQSPRYLLPDCVLDYIAYHHLYRN
jgi:nicotinate-nucleotide adenylyltransferase